MERKFRPEFINRDRFLKMTTFEKELELMRVADLIPYIVGEKGIGKSSKVKSYAKRIGMDFVKVELSNVDRVDFNGLLKFEEYKHGNGDPIKDSVIEILGSNSLPYHTHTLPNWVIRIFENHSKGIHTLLFFDEINRAPSDVINAIMNTLLEREYGYDRIQFPHTVFIVAAGNIDTEDYMVTEMDQAIKGRVIEFKMEPSFEEWKKNFVNFDFESLEKEIVKNEIEIDNKIDKVVINFLEKNTKLFFQDGIENDDGNRSAGVDPRRWEMTSNFIKAYNEIIEDKESHYWLLKGGLIKILGVDIGLKMFNYYKNNSIVSIKTLIDVCKNNDNKTAIQKIEDVLKELEIAHQKNIFDEAINNIDNIPERYFGYIMTAMPNEFLIQIMKNNEMEEIKNKLEEIDDKLNLGIYKRLYQDLIKEFGLEL
jgi:MoxR-like ATPase